MLMLPLLWLMLCLGGTGPSALASQVQLQPATDLRIEHMGAFGAPPLGIEPASDTSPLRLWWALPSTPRGLSQQAREIQVVQGVELVHSTGRVESDASEAVPLLAARNVDPDTAYAVRVRYWATGSTEEPSPWSNWLNFTTGLFTKADWSGAIWLAGDSSTQHQDVASQLRVSFDAQLDDLQRAQLFVGSRGYFKCWLNGEPVSDHEQGHTTTFEARTLYDTFPVHSLLQEGSNGLGCAVARGWYGEGGGMGTMNLSNYQRSLILKLSLHYHNGSHTSVISRATGGWTTSSGPYLNARIFSGVEYDARRETPGWTTSSYDESTSAVLWIKAKEDTTVPPDMQLRAAMTPFIRHTQTFTAVNFTQLPHDPEIAAGEWLYDFGQNAAAQISLRIPARANSRTTTVSDPDDQVVTFALAFAETRPGSGQGGEAHGSPVKYHTTMGRIARDGVNWTSHFTYDGFQFCTLTISSNSTGTSASAALPTPTIEALVSHFTHSDVDHDRSSISFNLPLLNQIQHMTRYASKSNLLDVPTDCPTRERAGWTGDGGLTREVTSYNFEMGPFYRKWLNDIGDAQATFRNQCMTQLFPRRPTHVDCDCAFRNCTGEVPPAAPWYQHGYHGGNDPADQLNLPGTDPAWGMAFMSISHHLLTWYGDREAIRKHYPGLQLYIDYLSKIPGVDPIVPPFTESGLLTYNVYADWDKPKGNLPGGPNVITGGNSSLVPIPRKGPRGTPSPLIGSWVMIKSLVFMVDIATALGHEDDATHYEAMAKRSATAFVHAYLREDEDGRETFADGALTQMSAIALALDLFPKERGAMAALITPETRTAVEAALYRAVVQADYHSLSGIIGQAPLFPAMSRASTRPPPTANASSLSLAALAARINTQTTFPSFGFEAKNGATTLWEMFGGGGTHNHIMFGTQSAWYYSDLAGIQMAPFDASLHASGFQRLLLKPAVTCEYLTAAINITFVNASVQSSRGLIRSMWRLSSCPDIPVFPAPPHPEPKTCALVLEKDKLQTNTTGSVELQCEAGGTIDAVLFADFGTPIGSCANGFKINSSCTSDPKNPAKTIVEKQCLGKNSCVLKANVQTFGHQCLYVPKRLAVEVSCKAGHPPPTPTPPLPLGPRHFDWSIMIPGGSNATVYVPLLAAEPDQVAIAVSTAAGSVERRSVWQSGGFVKGADAVTSAEVVGDSVAFQVRSGEFSFHVREGAQILPA